MAYTQRPQGTTYYESNTEVIREPYDSYSSGYPHQRNHKGAGGIVGKVVGAIVNNILPGTHGRHNSQHGEVIERREERIVERGYEPYGTNVVPGSYGRHNNNRGEFIEREERIYESAYEPCRRGY